MKETRLYLADDHAIVREGLRFILSSQPHYKVVGESGDGPIALQQIEEIKPDIAILDISLPGMTGIEIARQIRRYHPDIRIIMLSRHDNEEYLRELLKYKIHGYVLKDEAGSDLIRAIDAVMSGETYLSPRMVSMLVREKRPERTPIRAFFPCFQTVNERYSSCWPKARRTKRSERSCVSLLIRRRFTDRIL